MAAMGEDSLCPKEIKPGGIRSMRSPCDIQTGNEVEGRRGEKELESPEAVKERRGGEDTGSTIAGPYSLSAQGETSPPRA
jgi:hypothetical protein